MRNPSKLHVFHPLCKRGAEREALFFPLYLGPPLESKEHLASLYILCDSYATNRQDLWANYRSPIVNSGVHCIPFWARKKVAPLIERTPLQLCTYILWPPKGYKKYALVCAQVLWTRFFFVDNWWHVINPARPPSPSPLDWWKSGDDQHFWSNFLNIQVLFCTCFV